MKKKFFIFGILVMFSFIYSQNLSAVACQENSGTCITCVDWAEEHPRGGCAGSGSCQVLTVTCGHPE